MAVLATKQTTLESGDHLTRAEFHSRYCEQPDIKKAELINGVVYVASPVRLVAHGEPHADTITWLNTYRARHPGLRVGDNATVYLDGNTELQPVGDHPSPPRPKVAIPGAKPNVPYGIVRGSGPINRK